MIWGPSFETSKCGCGPPNPMKKSLRLRVARWLVTIQYERVTMLILSMHVFESAGHLHRCMYTCMLMKGHLPQRRGTFPLYRIAWKRSTQCMTVIFIIKNQTPLGSAINLVRLVIKDKRIWKCTSQSFGMCFAPLRPHLADKTQICSPDPHDIYTMLDPVELHLSCVWARWLKEPKQRRLHFYFPTRWTNIRFMWRHLQKLNKISVNLCSLTNKSHGIVFPSSPHWRQFAGSFIFMFTVWKHFVFGFVRFHSLGIAKSRQPQYSNACCSKLPAFFDNSARDPAATLKFGVLQKSKFQQETFTVSPVQLKTRMPLAIIVFLLAGVIGYKFRAVTSNVSFCGPA